MKRLIERVVARVSIVGLVFVSGCAALIGADFDKELAEADASGGTASGGTSPLNTGGVISSGGVASDGGNTSGGTDTGGASTGGSGVGGNGAGGDTGGSGTGGSGASNTGGVGTGGTSVGGSGGGSGGAGTGGTIGSSEKVAINEVYGYDGQFIELFNYGSFEYDLSEWAITNSAGTGPNPPLGRFPKNIKLAAGAYMLLQYQADFLFGITANEKFYLLDKFGSVVSELEYPGDANVPDGSSYGRDPNGTGTPKILSTPTPGEAN